ncbi:LUD domain-containing protein [Nocardia sp. NPDC088792]|uniref:LUD domain-containing protein n=1 Tax=Nocardia sp. NPDC088792 TaxID=3364332 RepID=UPI0038016FFC
MNVGERPDRQQLRDSAAAIEDMVRHHLDSYLVQLERAVEDAGGAVHWATGAAEANLLVDALVRQERLRAAEVGVTGANFLVAETGTIVMAESEGNGRVCPALPETLITVAGIETVVPTWRDLEVFLQLPARGSTGKRISPYVFTWAGVTDGDGPRNFHLVLVDDNRTPGHRAKRSATATNAREIVLARIRDALSDLPAEQRTITAPREYLRRAPGIEAGDHDAVVSLFFERVKHSGAQAHRVDASVLPKTIATVLHEHGVRSVIAPAGVPEGCLAEWTVDSGNRVVSDDPQLSTAELGGVDAVITICAAAIADSGTVVLDGGPGQGRRAPTLVPGCHVCVVHAEQIASSVPEMIGILDPLRPLTWLSPRSATADLEMICGPGVRGPRRLVVVIVE